MNQLSNFRWIITEDGKLDSVWPREKNKSRSLAKCHAMARLPNIWGATVIIHVFFYSFNLVKNKNIFVGRRDFLTEAILFWNEEKSNGIARALKQRLERVYFILLKSEDLDLFIFYHKQATVLEFELNEKLRELLKNHDLDFQDLPAMKARIINRLNGMNEANQLSGLKTIPNIFNCI